MHHESRKRLLIISFSALLFFFFNIDPRVLISSVAQSCLTLCNPMDCSKLPCPSPTPGACSNSFPSSWLCHPTISSSVVPFSSCLQSFPESVFSNESVLHIRWPKDWSFSFNMSPSNEYPGLISFTMDWLDLLAVQGSLKSLLQHHSSKASSMLSFLYGPTLTSRHDYWKNHSFD